MTTQPPGDGQQGQQMIISIRAFSVRVTGPDGEDLGPHLMARGFMPSGQVLIDGRIHAGHAPSVQSEAVAEVATWLRKHRDGWEIETLPWDGR